MGCYFDEKRAILKKITHLEIGWIGIFSHKFDINLPNGLRKNDFYARVYKWTPVLRHWLC